MAMIAHEKFPFHPPLALEISSREQVLWTRSSETVGSTDPRCAQATIPVSTYNSLLRSLLYPSSSSLVFLFFSLHLFSFQPFLLSFLVRFSGSSLVQPLSRAWSVESRALFHLHAGSMVRGSRPPPRETEFLVPVLPLAFRARSTRASEPNVPHAAFQPRA